MDSSLEIVTAEFSASYTPDLLLPTFGLSSRKYFSTYTENTFAQIFGMLHLSYYITREEKAAELTNALEGLIDSCVSEAVKHYRSTMLWISQKQLTAEHLRDANYMLQCLWTYREIVKFFMPEANVYGSQMDEAGAKKLCQALEVHLLVIEHIDDTLKVKPVYVDKLAPIMMMECYSTNYCELVLNLGDSFPAEGTKEQIINAFGKYMDPPEVPPVAEPYQAPAPIPVPELYQAPAPIPVPEKYQDYVQEPKSSYQPAEFSQSEPPQQAEDTFLLQLLDAQKEAMQELVRFATHTSTYEDTVKRITKVDELARIRGKDESAYKKMCEDLSSFHLRQDKERVSTGRATSNPVPDPPLPMRPVSSSTVTPVKLNSAFKAGAIARPEGEKKKKEGAAMQKVSVSQGCKICHEKDAALYQDGNCSNCSVCFKCAGSNIACPICKRKYTEMEISRFLIINS